METLSPQQDVTRLLVNWRNGDAAALEDLLPIIYKELRRLAGRYLRRERPDHTLQPTALVHEAWLRLAEQEHVAWQNRAHFFGVAAQVMRRILIDHARNHHRARRGGGRRKVSLDDVIELSQERAADLIALDDALKSLAVIDPRKSRVVELRYFGGLSVEETAEALGVSDKTVMRDWALARAWLYNAIRQGEACES
ncbi:MAG TPA: sigma-70 family RNA polymerase sigma factor [Blastocatellia bacterium]|nr:sigma-70 family RNA polymerase sigma factor [Blastocatellia bacterium]